MHLNCDIISGKRTLRCKFYTKAVKMTSDFYTNGEYTADISNKMRVPDRIMAHSDAGDWNETHTHDHRDVFNMQVPDRIAAHRESGNWSDSMHDQYAVNMQVPDRIQLAGSDQHVSNRSTPRELQLEHNVMQPTSEHVRVNTPPRSIKLEDLAYPTADDPRQFPPSPLEKSTFRPRQLAQSPMSRGPGLEKGVSYDADTSLSTYNEQNLSPSEEIQLMKRQIAKLNHRLMATELENQQQQQRELVFTIAVSAYFLVKALVWINKSI